MAKAAYWTVTDVEARKRGEQTGLDTTGSPAVNDEYWECWEQSSSVPATNAIKYSTGGVRSKE